VKMKPAMRVPASPSTRAVTYCRPRPCGGAKGRKLLDKISEETGLFFDKENYELIEPETEENEADGLVLGHFATEREAALAYDRAMILLYGHQAETNFPPEESEHVTLPVEVTRQINALKVGRGRLQ
jgi:hypothetical protein